MFVNQMPIQNKDFKVKQINPHCLEIHKKGHQDIIVVDDQYQLNFKWLLIQAVLQVLNS